MKRLLPFVLMALAAPISAQTVVMRSETPVAPFTVSPMATEIAAKLFPNVTYRRMLGDGFGKIIMPKIMQAMPVPVGDAAKAAVTVAERNELVALLGVDPKKMKQ
jgi:hypothetical protein